MGEIKLSWEIKAKEDRCRIGDDIWLSVFTAYALDFPFCFFQAAALQQEAPGRHESETQTPPACTNANPRVKHKSAAPARRPTIQRCRETYVGAGLAAWLWENGNTTGWKKNTTSSRSQRRKGHIKSCGRERLDNVATTLHCG